MSGNNDLISREKVLQIIRNCAEKANSKDTLVVLLESVIEMMDGEDA